MQYAMQFEKRIMGPGQWPKPLGYSVSRLYAVNDLVELFDKQGIIGNFG
jgi:hypothetical protein